MPVRRLNIVSNLYRYLIRSGARTRASSLSTNKSKTQYCSLDFFQGVITGSSRFAQDESRGETFQNRVYGMHVSNPLNSKQHLAVSLISVSHAVLTIDVL